jgi:FkbM family methyltransferase
MSKRFINGILRKCGYQISKTRTLEYKISVGEYKWLQDFGIKTVIDVGANIGQFALIMHKIINDVAIYSFEPISECYKELVNRKEQINNLKCFNLALGGETREGVINRNEFLPSSSLLAMESLHKEAFPYTAKTNQEKIRIASLDKIHNEIDWVQKILLKIDVQGYELEVLKGAKNSLNSVDLIIIETSFLKLYKNQPLFEDVYNFLYSRSFLYRGNFDQITNPITGRILQADAIFVKQK